METILLTSAGMVIKEEILKILPKPANQLRVAYIITASKVEDDIFYVERDYQIMIDLGFDINKIDIEGKTESELYELFSDKDIVYVQGGNPFYLLKHVKISGFDKVIKELIKKGIIYIGVSAGSYIACPTIEMSYWKNKDRDNFGLTDLTGLDLVPFLLSVHFEPKYELDIRRGASNTKYPARILTDKQAILMKNGIIEFIGEGEEIKL